MFTDYSVALMSDADLIKGVDDFLGDRKASCGHSASLSTQVDWNKYRCTVCDVIHTN